MGRHLEDGEEYVYTTWMAEEDERVRLGIGYPGNLELWVRAEDRHRLPWGGEIRKDREAHHER